MGTETEREGFKIGGDYITEQARDFCLAENDWDGAYRFLVDNIMGIDHNIAVAILRGEKRLTGMAGFGIPNTLALEDEIPERKAEIEERMNWLWAGTIKFRPDYWRPYAIVTNWGRKDVGAGNRYGNRRYEFASPAIPVDTPGNRSRFERWGKSRNCEYMNDPQNDQVHYLKFPKGHDRAGESVAVLFEKVSQPPVWWVSIPSRPECWVESLVAYCEVHSLSERGHNQKFGQVDALVRADFSDPLGMAAVTERRLRGDKDNEDENNDASTSETPLKQQMLEQVTQLSGLDPEAAAGTIEHIFGSGDEEEIPPTPDEPKEHNYGWITRDGKFYGCMYHHHAAIAKRIWKFVEKTTDEDKLANPERAGEDAGWVKVTKSAIDGNYKMVCCKSPTERQQKTLEDWAVWHRQDPNDLEVLR